MNEFHDKSVPAKASAKKVVAPRPAMPVIANTMTAPAAIAAATVAPIVSDVHLEPAPTPAEPLQKGPTMNDALNNTAEQTKTFVQDSENRATAMFSDLNTRAKSAMERSTKMVEDMNEFNKGNIEALVESSRVAAKAAEQMAQQTAEMARKNFETVTHAMKSFASIKTPTEFFQLQSDYARNAFDSMMSETSKNSETMLKLAGEVFQPISNRMAVAAEKMKIAA